MELHLRPILALAVLMATSACATQAAPTSQPQIAFLNHAFVVLDQETADAIEHSDYLRRFGVLTVSTTHADRGESWTGHYITGRQTYLELFGPRDGGGDLNSTGIVLSPDRVGGLAELTTRLAQEGVANPDTGQRSRQYGAEQVPWFNMVSPHGDGDALSIWAIEYLPSFMNDARSEKEPAAGPDDVISRERSLPDEYQARLMRDVSAVEIATTPHDIAMARPMFAAAGFAVTETPAHLIARDNQTTITLDAVTRDHGGMRRIDFVLNAPAAPHVEQIGHSTLTVGPGAHATWLFAPPG